MALAFYINKKETKKGEEDEDRGRERAARAGGGSIKSHTYPLPLKKLHFLLIFINFIILLNFQKKKKSYVNPLAGHGRFEPEITPLKSIHFG